MAETKEVPTASQTSRDKVDVEEHSELHIHDLHLEHSHGYDKELKDAELKEARNADFAAAVATGGTNPLSKAAFVIYACRVLHLFSSPKERFR